MNETKLPPDENLSTAEIQHFIQLASSNLARAKSASYRTVQKSLQDLADTLKLFRDAQIEIDLNAPEFSQPLSEAGLVPAGRITKPEKNGHSIRYSDMEVNVIRNELVKRMLALNGKPIKLKDLCEGLPMRQSSQTAWMARKNLWPEGYQLTKPVIGHYALVRK